MSRPPYSVQYCRRRIAEIDRKLEELEDKPQRQGVGPYQLGWAGKMSDLRKERSKWEQRLRAAKRRASSGSSMNADTEIT